MRMPRATYLQRPAILIERADAAVGGGRYREARLEISDARQELLRALVELRAEEERRGAR